MLSRRALLKRLSTLSLFGLFGSGVSSMQSCDRAPGTTGERDIADELGIRTFINAAGTYTSMTGCLIAAARFNSPPRGGNIGRGMKVNKEEILGMYAAVKRYVEMDHDKQWQMWEDRIALIEDKAGQVDGVATEVTVPPIANHTPSLAITWDESKIDISQEELRENLREGDPSIEMRGSGENTINLTVFMLQPGEAEIVGERIREELSRA